MRIIAYVDGFNFYRGLTRNTPYKWCDLHKLCNLLLPREDILAIKLFAAYSKEFPDKPGQAQRQNIYLRALQLDPIIQLFPSTYVRCEMHLPLVNSPRVNPVFVEVRNYKEKGSDVKIATQIISDALDDNYDMAAIFTNDSDLLAPLQLVRYKLKKQIYLMVTCNTDKSPNSKALQKAANYVKLITLDHLANSQFETVIKRQGKSDIIKPALW